MTSIVSASKEYRDLLRDRLLYGDDSIFIDSLYTIHDKYDSIDLIDELGMAEIVDGEICDVGWLENLPADRRLFVALWLIDQHHMDSELQDNMANKLNLRAMNLTGIETTALCHCRIHFFKSIRDLNLSRNALTRLPQTFSQMVNLESLDLHGNQITDLSGMLTSYSKLQHLFVDDNRLKLLPDDLNLLVHLKTLDAQRNDLREIPNSFLSLHQLKWVNLSRNQLTHVPLFLSQLTNLNHLDLRFNPIVGPIPKIKSARFDSFQWKNFEVQSIEDLIHLDLSFLNLGEIELDAIKGNSLEILNLAGNQLHQLPPGLSKFTNLKVLDLRLNPIQHLSDSIPQLTSLEWVVLEEDQGDIASLFSKIVPKVRIKIWNQTTLE